MRSHTWHILWRQWNYTEATKYRKPPLKAGTEPGAFSISSKSTTNREPLSTNPNRAQSQNSKPWSSTARAIPSQQPHRKTRGFALTRIRFLNGNPIPLLFIALTRFHFTLTLNGFCLLSPFGIWKIVLSSLAFIFWIQLLQSIIPITISRVNQVDAARLDVEMSAMLKEQMVKVFSLMKVWLNSTDQLTKCLSVSFKYPSSMFP